MGSFPLFKFQQVTENTTELVASLGAAKFAVCCHQAGVTSAEVAGDEAGKVGRNQT